MMDRLLIGWRLLRGVIHLAHGWWQVRRYFPHLDDAARGDLVQRWANRLLALWGVSLQTTGTRSQGPVLLVANHISWLDIMVMHAAGYARFVSKADVKRWPVLGQLITAGGTLYIERSSRRDAMRVVHDMAEALQAGQVLAVFPEGTTSDGQVVLPFHPNLLQAALATGTPVQVVALRYVDTRTGQRSGAPAYVGDDSMLDSVWRTLRAGGSLQAQVHYGEPQTAGERDRREWARDLHREVVQLLAAAQGAPASQPQSPDPLTRAAQTQQAHDATAAEPVERG